MTRKADQATIEKTIVNWSGLVFAIALWLGTWLLGAGVARLVDRRVAFGGATFAAVIALAALAVAFA